MKRHVVLVGLPGSGKSTVGRALARRLGLAFVDIDDRISAAEGRSVAAVWVALGEAAFRELERREMAGALAGPDAVIAPGAGWATIPGALSRAGELAFIIYLRVGAATAAARAAGQGGQETRPVLGAAPQEKLSQLLEQRERFYLQADLILDNEGSEQEAVTLIRKAMSL